ncbi:MAG: MFS transporter [Bacillota bacterium]|nr:MFS transporter [Bacillota bacterium]
MIITKNNNRTKYNLDLLFLIILISIPFTLFNFNHNGFLGLLPLIREEFTLNRTQIGYYSTLFFISSAVVAVFAGTIVDKIGSQKSMLLGVGSMSLMMVFYGLSNSYNMLLAFAFWAGLSSCLITPSINREVRAITMPENRASFMGLIQSGFGFGGIAGASLLPIIGETIGWRYTIQLSAVFTMIIAYVVYKLHCKHVNNYYQVVNRSGIYIKHYGKNKFIKDNFLPLLANKSLMKLCYIGLIFGAATSVILTHLVVYLSGDLAISYRNAGIGFGIFQLGGIVGRLTWGLLSDKLLGCNRRKTLLFVGLAAGVIFLLFGLLLYSSRSNLTTVYIFLFTLGLIAYGWNGVHLISIGELAGDERIGIATGLSVIFTRTGMFIAPPLFGFIADYRGNYQYSWLIFGVFIILLSICIMSRE